MRVCAVFDCNKYTGTSEKNQINSLPILVFCCVKFLEYLTKILKSHHIVTFGPTSPPKKFRLHGGQAIYDIYILPACVLSLTYLISFFCAIYAVSLACRAKTKAAQDGQAGGDAPDHGQGAPAFCRPGIRRRPAPARRSRLFGRAVSGGKGSKEGKSWRTAFSR